MMQRKRKSTEKFEIVADGLICKYCTFETENIDELDEHILNHEQDTSDDLIVQDTSNPDKVRKHKKLKQDDSVEFKCELCPYKTKRKFDFPKHVLTHSYDTVTVYKCSQCSYETKRKNDMPKHMLAHCTNVQMYKCPDCPYETKRKCDLPKHLLCHKPIESVPLYKCDYCQYVTKRKGDLPKHIVNHQERSKIKLFECTECEYVTKRKNDLHKHMLVHCNRHITGVFKCLKCSYATEKMHKFSKHALSGCNSWEDCISIEHLMLEDILSDVDQDVVQVVDNESVIYEEVEKEQVVEYKKEEEECENQKTTVVRTFSDEYLQFAENVRLNKLTGEEIQEAPIDEPDYVNQIGESHGVFRINLGEFSVDEEVVSLQQDTTLHEQSSEQVES